jgi:hypothetical protein
MTITAIMMKTVAAGLCAVALTTATPRPAEAGNNGRGLAIGIATGLILGGVLLNNRRAHGGPRVTFRSNYDADECYRERIRERQCWINDYGQRRCRIVERRGRLVCY